MAPLVVLTASFLILRALGALGVRPLRSTILCLRVALAAMFLLTASAHFDGKRQDLVRMVPPGFPHPELLVTLTGLAEIAGAIGLLVPRLAPFAAGGLALLLLALFPANVHAAREGLTIGGRPVLPILSRALVQLVFLAAVLAAGFWGRRRGAAVARAARDEQAASHAARSSHV
ncbi:MAG TPA: DoxX family membrane protein [Anaeromyxobacteraceae bacterium]|nr:DoxX family membrane protein [Anaeromyxobacteraceae bacterium]